MSLSSSQCCCWSTVAGRPSAPKPGSPLRADHQATILLGREQRAGRALCPGFSLLTLCHVRIHKEPPPRAMDEGGSSQGHGTEAAGAPPVPRPPHPAVPSLLLSCCLPGCGHRFPSPAADSEAPQPLRSAGLVAALWLRSHPRRSGTHGAVVQPSVPGQRPTTASDDSALLPLGLTPPRRFASRRRGQDVPTDAFQEPLRTRSYFFTGKTFCGKAESVKKERF